MKILWIGDKAHMPKEAAAMRTLAQTPSLFSLSVTKDFDAVLLDCRRACPYSLPHILSATAELQRESIFFCVMGSENLRERLSGKNSRYLIVAEDVEAALQELHLRQQLIGQENEKVHALNDFVVQPQKKPFNTSFDVPKDITLVIDVVGSQPRIGVTTQCLQLYHYFSALGRKAAVIMPAKQLTMLGKIMEHTSIQDGILIGGIPVVAVMSRRYDCYIRDQGCLDESNQALQDSDLCVLVAGAKPWELVHTAKALSALRRHGRLLPVFSYSSAAALDALRPLLEEYADRAVFAPWQPDPFQAAGSGAYTAIKNTLEQQFAQQEQDWR